MQAHSIRLLQLYSSILMLTKNKVERNVVVFALFISFFFFKNAILSTHCYLHAHRLKYLNETTRHDTTRSFVFVARLLCFVSTLESIRKVERKKEEKKRKEKKRRKFRNEIM